MQIHSSLLLLATVTFIFAPALSRWLSDAGSVWYLRHVVWLLIIIFVFVSLHQQRRNDP